MIAFRKMSAVMVLGFYAVGSCLLAAGLTAGGIGGGALPGWMALAAVFFAIGGMWASRSARLHWAALAASIVLALLFFTLFALLLMGGSEADPFIYAL